MRKLTAIMCAILVFTTTTIPVYAEDEIYIEPGQNASENMESENMESENIDSENMESENIDSENMESENMESENMESENMESVDESEDAGESDEDGVPVVLAETSVTVGDFEISGENLNSNDYSYSSNSPLGKSLTIKSSKAITVSTPNNNADNPTNARIIVNNSLGGAADITLSGVYIQTSAYAAFEINNSKTTEVTVTLEGDNMLTSGGSAGLQNNTIPLIIKEKPGASGSLTAHGGSGGAGIGGSNGSGSNITIESGTVTANGGSEGGAGIGGGRNGSGSNITIKSGTVTANGGGGAGIGGGSSGSGSNITIKSGTIIANGGSNGGAGIGGGASGGSGSDITIESGTITANGGSNGGAGIGGGASGGSGSSIIITGGMVTATGGSNGGAGIGGGASGGSGSNITITGGNVKAESIQGAAGIGGGTGGGDGTNITIEIGSGEKVEAISTQGGAGIGGGGAGSGSGNGTDIKITVSGSGEVIAKNISASGAGIGGGGLAKGNNGTGITITVNDAGKVTATGGIGGGAGIGGGKGGSGGAEGANNGITINVNGSGKVTATGGTNGGAGIGGGAGGNGGAEGANNGITINVNGSGTVEATGNGGGAGIGGGASGGSGTGITISGSGTVEATGGITNNSGGAGIGGGSKGGSGEKIKIDLSSGGKVIANGGSPDTGSVPRVPGGAGIGGGDGGDGIDITIKGSGTVEAIGGSLGGTGIGGGAGYALSDGGNGIRIVIEGGIITAEGGIGGADGVGASGAPAQKAQGDVSITGGNVTIKNGGLGNGKGNDGSNGSVKISGGTVDTTGSKGIFSNDIAISAGKVTATGNSGAGIDGNQITISGGEVTATGKSLTDPDGKGINGSDITISAGKVKATGKNGAGIDGNQITISGGEVTATGEKGAGIDGSDITISAGKVTADGTTAGIGSDSSTVEIKGVSESETSFPWVETSKIVSQNGNGDYQGIVFDKYYKEHYGEDADVENVKAVRQEHKPDGVVYGNVDLSKLDEAYELESGKTLVVKGKLTTNNKLTLADGSTLYLEEGAKLDNYEAVNGYDVNRTDENRSRILHESKSDHEVNGTICKICGSPVPHQWSKDWSSDDDCHWHECTADDCSVIPDPSITCTISENSEKDGYGEHVFGAPVKDENDGKLYLICSVCGRKKPYVTTIQLIKKDNKGEALKDAEFELYSDQDCKIPIAENSKAMSDQNGKVSFAAGIEPGKTYYIKETKAPDGYRASDEVYKAVVDADGMVTYSIVDSKGIVIKDLDDIPECVNTKIPDPIQIYKVDGGGKALAGAKFKLYSDAGCAETAQVGEEVTAAETTIDVKTKAVASFTVGIEVGRTYYIRETKAPDGYKKSDKVYKAVVDADGKVTYSIVDPEGKITELNGIPECVNTKINPDPVQIIKVDGEGKALTGAKFKLYSDENCTETKQVGAEVTAAETTIDGEAKAVASFTVGIELGKTYYIKETQAPSGYTASDKVYKAVVGTDGKVTYSVVGPEGNVTVPNGIPECVNTKIIPDPVQIYKVDGGGEALAGAKFKLYSDAGCAETAQVGEEVTAAETTIDGKTKAVASFTAGIEPGKTYYIKETKAPDGYRASDKVYKAVVGADGKVTYSIVDPEGNVTAALKGIPECVNTKIIPDPVKIILEDGETGAPLAGAEFGIYSDKQCTEANRIAVGTTKIDTDSASDTYNKAVVSFKTELGRAYCIIELDTTYYIKETQAPEGYIASEEVYKVVVGIDGKVSYGTAGSEETKETVPVCKNYAVKITYTPQSITKVEETGNPIVLSPKTGDTGEAGAAGIAILSGIAWAAFLVGVLQKRKRKKELFL